MRRSSIALLAAALAACTLSTARDAHALGPVDIEAGAKLGMGTNPSNNNGAANPLGLGLGARGGVSFLGLYGGVNLVYYFGSSKSQTIDGASFSESVHSLLYGLEAGYGIKLLSLLTLRAQLGLGNAGVTGSGSGSGAVGSASTSTTNNYLYLEPGVTAMVSLGMWFVGADVNALVLTGVKNGSGGSSTDTALTWHGQVGVTF
jgi:hypothetical protein